MATAVLPDAGREDDAARHCIRDRTLNIYVDGMFFRLSGIGRCYENLLRALSGAPEVGRIFTVVPRNREEEFRRMFPSARIEVRFVDFAPLGFSDIFRKGNLIRRFLPRPDLFFFPNFDVPFFLDGKIVSTVNDLIPVSRHSDLSFAKKAAFDVLVRRALRVSDRVVSISEHTRREAMARYGIPGDRFRVIYPWIDSEFLASMEDVRDEEPLVSGEYLLYVGNRFVHKNLKAMFEATRLLLPEHPALKAVVAGARMRVRDDVDIAREDPALRGRVVELTRPTDREVKNLYANARVFVFPTFIEGFGLPPLEAMAFGVPVVCSDIPVIREVCGDAVRYADPGSPQSFAGEIRTILQNSAVKGALVEAGRRRSQRFGIEAAMQEYRKLFLSVVGGLAAP